MCHALRSQFLRAPQGGGFLARFLMKQWLAAMNGATIIALQHCCGIRDAPVNCFIDERGNWTCPNCLMTYGAPTPIDPAERQSVQTIFEDEEE